MIDLQFLFCCAIRANSCTIRQFFSVLSPWLGNIKFLLPVSCSQSKKKIRKVSICRRYFKMKIKVQGKFCWKLAGDDDYRGWKWSWWKVHCSTFDYRERGSSVNGNFLFPIISIDRPSTCYARPITANFQLRLAVLG